MSPNLSEYRAMWLFCLFDLPVKTKQERRDYTLFRGFLMKQGFSRFQYSVYARYCDSVTGADQYRRRIRQNLPPGGHVRILGVTDRQFGKMEVYYGKKRTKAEDKPEQLVLF